MKKILFISSFIISSFLYASEVAKVEITQEDVKTQNEISDASSKDITPKSLNDFFEEFADNFDIEYGETKNGKTFYVGKADVLVGEKDPEFSKALQNAYQKALLNLQTEFIRDAFGRIAIEKLANYEADNSTNAKEFEELKKGGVLNQLTDKITQLAGAKLDQALKDMGVNVEGLTQERKKTLFKDEFINKTMVQAMGSMSGLVPVQTILTQKRGEYQIGVIAVISDKTRQIARDMSLSRKSLIKGKGKNIKDYLPSKKEGYLNEYGIRLVYDENGSPVILSYGSWGFVLDPTNNKLTNRLEDIAQKKAETIADASIIEFINVNINFNEEQLSGEKFEKILKESINLSNEDKQQEEKTISNIIDKVNSKIKSTSSGKIRGIRTIKKWSLTDENGIEYTGVVRFYSYSNYENTTNALKPVNTSNAKDDKSQEKAIKVKRQSNVVNTIDDF